MGRTLSHGGRGAAGAKFENAVKARLEDLGYCTMRSAGSSGPIDVIGLSPAQDVIVQAKRSGDFRWAEWNAFFELARALRKIPLFARAGDTVDEVQLWRITGQRKKRSRELPCEPWPAPG